MEDKDLLESFDRTVVDGVSGTTNGQYLNNLLTKAAFFGGISWDEAEAGYRIIFNTPELNDLDTWMEGQLSVTKPR